LTLRESIVNSETLDRRSSVGGETIGADNPQVIRVFSSAHFSTIALSAARRAFRIRRVKSATALQCFWTADILVRWTRRRKAGTVSGFI
jgi:hypothetical protein